MWIFPTSTVSQKQHTLTLQDHKNQWFSFFSGLFIQLNNVYISILDIAISSRSLYKFSTNEGLYINARSEEAVPTVPVRKSIA